MNAVTAQRELTTDERIAQIGWLIVAERADALANFAKAKARAFDLMAGDPNAAQAIKQFHLHAEWHQCREDALLEELGDLRPVLQADDGA